MASEMIPDDRVSVFLRKAEIDSPPKIPTLARLSDSGSSPSESDLELGLSMLVEQRTNEPGFRQPEQKKRYFLKNEEWKKEKSNVSTWVFTKHEVAKAFGGLLDREPLVSASVAQALLSHITPTPIDELWCHFHDKKLEKRMSRRFFARRSSSVLIPNLPWLDWATRHDHLDYIRLLCRTGVAQADLDRSFGVALSNNSMESMTILLRGGAVASSFQVIITEQIKLSNRELATLLLSVPEAMSVDTWRLCLEPELQKDPPLILLQCLTHRPDIVCAPLLLLSLAAKNFAATAIILAYAKSNEDFHEARQHACELTSQVQEDELRLKLFSVLAMSELLMDIPVLREELMKDVKTRQLQLVQLLVDSRVSVDIEPNNAVSFAVSRMDLETLELFRHGTFASSVSPLLNLVPSSASESDILQFIDIFGHMGLAGEPLHAQLVHAVRKQYVQLVEKLLGHGASIEFEQASAVRAALETADLDLLSILLQHDCSPNILSAAIPVAMNMTPRSSRLKAMQSLTQKGVLARELGIPLQTLAAETGDIDYELIRLVLQHQAPVDGVGDNSKNAVFVATRRGLVALLQLLCDASPDKETLSNALPMAFDTMHTHNYEIVFNMINVLLQAGATGEPADQTLLNAAMQDDQLKIVRLLLDSGADTNYKSGTSFTAAILLANFELLKLLCASCPPSPATTKSILFLATTPPHFNLKALDLLLSTTSNVDTLLTTSWSSEQFKGNVNIIPIVRCFLRHGMDADLGNGTLLCFAVQERNAKLLAAILTADTSLASLKTAFAETTSIRERHIKLLHMRLLLEKAKSAEIGQSAALMLETNHALMDDSAIFETLLLHKADVDLEKGMAVQMAAAAGSLRTLDALIGCRPAELSIYRACITTAFSTMIGLEQKSTVFRRLLDTSGVVTVECMTSILAESVKVLPEFTQLPELLLARGAVVDLDILKVALKRSSQALFMMLANSAIKVDPLLKLFRIARDTKLASDRRYWVYKYLLSRGMNKDDVSEALLKALTYQNAGDLSLSQLLLENGASVNHKGGAALTTAFSLKSFDAVVLLNQYFADDKTANFAFELAWKYTSLDKDMRFGVYQCFLAWHIEASSIQRALVENLAQDLLDADIVELLLEHGADPNKENARCFAEASKKGAEDAFRALSRYGNPDLEVVLKSLLEQFKEEWQVVWWFGICLEEHLNPTRICQEELLFLCMRTFPNGTTLLKLLLDKGVPTSAKVNTRLCPGWEPEVCTALIWAIRSSKPRIGNDVILTLLSRGGNKALPAYSTPISKVSAAFACVIDSTRTSVLKALIDLDRPRVMAHTMLESRFTYLAAYPESLKSDQSLPENAHELGLRVASVYTGNFKAFRLMEFQNKPNDGMLSPASLLALPKFIQWLVVNGHDPNYRDEETNMMIPLAMVCSSTYMASCKIANSEASLLLRQEQSMKILAAKTDLNWKYRGKTVLHFALEGGIDVTKAMIVALNLSQDREKDERYLYVDRTGIHYSPDQYVTKIMKINEREQTALVMVLKGCGLISRYYRNVEPGAGEQPTDYQGLPQRLRLLWDGPSGEPEDDDF